MCDKKRKFFVDRDPKLDNDLCIALARLPKPPKIIDALNNYTTIQVTKENINTLIRIWPKDLLADLMQETIDNPDASWGNNEAVFIEYGKATKFYDKL